jgi:hypothetical protein
MDEIITLSPLGILGYGIPEESVDRARHEFDIDVIAVDAGSMDPGPNYLGRGSFFADEEMIARDVRILLDAADAEDVPFLIGTAGGSGSREHLNRFMDVFRRVVDEGGFEFTVAKIYTDVEPSYVVEKIRADDVVGLGLHDDLDEGTVGRTEKLVGQVGVSPFVEALERGADVVVGGRSSDLSPFAALPLREGFDPGLTYHLGKILECGARATTAASGNDCLVGILREDHFEVVPPNPDRRCTTESVAAHTLYEKADPTTIKLSEGAVDVGAAEFEQVDDRTVRVTGSTYEERPSPNVLIEGVERVGARTITPAGVRDPELVRQIDELLEHVYDRVERICDVPTDDYQLTVRTYGLDEVPLTDVRAETLPEEMGIIIDVVAVNQSTANTICGLARSTLLHYPLEGRINSGGNLAFPYSPSDIPVGEVYTLSVYHLLQNVDHDAIPTLELEELAPAATEVA